jgi:hypothetical protein
MINAISDQDEKDLRLELNRLYGQQLDTVDQFLEMPLRA